MTPERRRSYLFLGLLVSACIAVVALNVYDRPPAAIAYVSEDLPQEPLSHSPNAATSLPPLPLTMPSAIGPIDVKRVVDLTCNALPALGCFSGELRYLAIRDSIPLIVAYQAYYHEGVHVAFFYSGLVFKSAVTEDKIADAVANQNVMYLLAKASPTAP